jgi:predicted O-methyltransferase YrrM
LNQVLEEIIESGYVKSPSGNLVKVRSNITREEGEFSTEIIAGLMPNATLEVGLAYGISALFICQAIKKYSNARHIIIDPSQNTDWGGLGLYSLKRAGYEEIIDFYEKPSQTVLPQLEAMGVKVDFAFIDGWHTFDHTLVDFFYIDKLLNIGGVVAFDDSNWPSISKVIKFIVKNRSYKVFRYLPNTFPPLRLNASLKFQIYQRVKGLFRNVRAFGIGIDPNSTCVALRKEAEDNRRWDFHSNF